MMATQISPRSLDFANGNLRFLSRLILAAVLPVFLFLLPAAALALCMPHAEFDAWLEEHYGETPAFYGVTAGGLARVYRNEAEDTWTIARAQVGSGRTCMIMGGEAWREEAREDPET